METILITGGSGLIGSHLCRILKDKGYNVTLLSRENRKNTDIQSYTWDIDKQLIQQEALETADYIIHLAGASIGGKRWTARRKRLIVDSRIKTANLLYEKIQENKKKLKAFISASAIGYYGMVTSGKIFCETDPPATDFLGETCYQWEQSADRFQNSGIRTVKIRIGVVLTKQGGALTKMTMPVKIGIGSAIGTGRQYMPWIHIDDLCNIFIKAIEDINMNGPYNAVAPDHKTNSDFTKHLALILKKPFWFPDIPGFLLQLIFGKMSDILLYGSRVSSDKIRTAGYNFLFPNLTGALTEIFAKQ